MEEWRMKWNEISRCVGSYKSREEVGEGARELDRDYHERNRIAAAGVALYHFLYTVGCFSLQVRMYGLWCSQISSGSMVSCFMSSYFICTTFFCCTLKEIHTDTAVCLAVVSTALNFAASDHRQFYNSKNGIKHFRFNFSPCWLVNCREMKQPTSPHIHFNVDHSHAVV